MIKIQKSSDILNKLIKDNGFTSYLEIGIACGDCYFSIICPKKFGVDPDPHREFIKEHPTNRADSMFYNTTSNIFFESLNRSDVYDLIFIDGDHTHEQVDIDIQNALNYISNKGLIMLHDANPPTRYHARENHNESTPAGTAWNGTVYKSIIKLRNLYPDISLYTVDVDEGCCVIDPRSIDLKNIDSRNIDSQELDYDIFYNNKQEILNLITSEEFSKHK